MSDRSDSDEELGPDYEQDYGDFSPSKDSSMSDEERLQLAFQQIARLEEELNDFQKSSYELEQELEKELNQLSDEKMNLEEMLAEKQAEVDNWRNKYLEIEKELNGITETNETKYKNYKRELQSVRSKLVNIEILNDNIEQNERILSINLNDLESKYNDSLERIALLESELNYKNELLSKEKLSHQNTKNQLMTLQNSDDVGVASGITSGTIDSSFISSHTTKSAPLGSRRYSQVSALSANTTNSMKTIPKSNSIKQLHNMIEQTKFMENRVETIRNTIRPSKMRKVSGKTSITAQPSDYSSDSIEVDSNHNESYNLKDVILKSSDNNNAFYGGLTKSTTNDSLNHTKAKTRKIKKSNLQKPPIQPLSSKKEFGTHFLSSEETLTTNSNFSTIKSSSDSRSTLSASNGINTVRTRSYSAIVPLEPIKGSPKTKINSVPRVKSSPKTAEVKKLFHSPKAKKKSKGLLPSLRKFNIGEK